MDTQIGNYELLQPLGSGGMAQTFVARRRGPAGFEQKVCLKRVLPEYARDHAFVEQFLDEARLLAHLRHANVVQVYDFGEADGVYFMALELIEGADLETVMRFAQSRGQRLPEPLIAHVVVELLRALHYTHEVEVDGEPLSLVHRDVSPSNVLLSRHGEVKLADFGIAKSRHRRHKTAEGRTKGKLAYMSPEQVRGFEVDARSDLFALGIVLHELLTGVHPFETGTELALLDNILKGTRPPLAALAPDVSAAMTATLDRLLAVDPSERPASAAEALALLPPIEHRFQREQELAALVSACMAALGEARREPSGQHGAASRPRSAPRVDSVAARSNATERSRSKAPLIAAGIVVALIGAGGLWLAARGAERSVSAPAPLPIAPSVAERDDPGSRPAAEVDPPSRAHEAAEEPARESASKPPLAAPPVVEAASPKPAVTAPARTPETERADRLQKRRTGPRSASEPAASPSPATSAPSAEPRRSRTRAKFDPTEF